MNISGKIWQILPEVKGEGKNGPWSRQDLIVETEEQFPKKVCISVWNNKIKVTELKAGDPVNVEITVESREYNGRWYTDVKAISLLSATHKGTASNVTNPWDKDVPPLTEKDIPEADPDSNNDDLPF